MKKNWWIIAALCLVAGPVAAQEVNTGKGTLTFSGKVASGVFFDSDDAIKESRTGTEINDHLLGTDGRVRMWNESDNKSPLRMDLSATYVLDNTGLKLRLRANSALDGFDRTVIAPYAYGWVNLFSEGLKFTGGYIDLADNVWGTLGDGDWDIGGNGIRMEVKPFKFFNLDESALGSLNFGAFFIIPPKDNPYNGRDEGGKEFKRKVTAERVLQETVFGLRYTHPWFYAGVQVQLDSDIDGVDIYEGISYSLSSTPGSVTGPAWSTAGDEMRLMFGAGFTMLPELVFTVEGNFEGMGNWEARGSADLRQTLSYTLFTNLTIGVKAQELIWGYNVYRHLENPYNFELSPWMQFKPFVNYKVTPEFTAGLEGGFGSGHLVIGSFSPEPDNANAVNWTKNVGFVNEKYNIYVKPNLAYNFANGLALKLWYQVTFIGYADLGDDPLLANLRNSLAPKAIDNYEMVDSLLKQQVALEFIWSF